MSPLAEVIVKGFSLLLLVMFGITVLQLVFSKGFSWFKEGGKPVVPIQPYSKVEYFFTPAEKKFFDVLVEAAGNEVVVLSKCRVADLIDVDAQKHFGPFNRIKSKHIDFVLVEKSDGALLCAIELDDKSHQRKKRVERDQFLDEVFAQVELPLFRFKVKREYSVADIHKGLGM